MKSDIRTKIYNEYILTDDRQQMVATILESDLWWLIVDVMALTFKKLAEEKNISVEDVINDILNADDFLS